MPVKAFEGTDINRDLLTGIVVENAEYLAVVINVEATEILVRAGYGIIIAACYCGLICTYVIQLGVMS